MDFHNCYAQGMARIASVTLPVADFDPLVNGARIGVEARQLSEQGVAVALFPELSVTGYAIDDLLLQDSLLAATTEAVGALTAATGDLMPLIVVGAPVTLGGRLYNCAVAMHRGRVLGVAPKSYLPNYQEFYEKRHFAAGQDCPVTEFLEPTWSPDPIPVGTKLIFQAEDLPDLAIHVELCEDAWVPISPSSQAALAGATVLLNLSASPITIGKADTRHRMVAQLSASCVAAYAYSAAMFGESTTDLSWDGMTLIYEMGDQLAASERFPSEAQASVADVDLELIRNQRRKAGSFDDNRRETVDVDSFRRVTFRLDPPTGDLGLRREVARFPFVPNDVDRLEQDCYEAYNIQVSGLERRILAIGGNDPARAPKLCIGISGGLDSSHALLVAAKATDRLGLSRKHILAYTMPGFATSDHTRNNAEQLAESLGVTFEEVDIRPMARQMLSDLGHPFADGEPTYDVTFENVQAGIRYDFLFRAANQQGGIVVGTGDLSELALGWCTFGVGDQMSHYGVNAGVPKTLIQHLIRWVSYSAQFAPETSDVLDSILATEISPELIPAEPGEAPQSTQASIGPYELQDFNLYYLLRYGLRPSKIAFLAEHAWSAKARGAWPPWYPADERRSYDLATIRSWLELFVRRFATNQFKRSTLPNGPKVCEGGTLSPRGDWRMPSDVGAGPWLTDIIHNIPTGR